MLTTIPYFNFLLGTTWVWVFATVYFLLAVFYFSGKLPIKTIKWFLWVLATTLILRAGLKMFFTYLVWSVKGTQGSYLLPPYQPISYFLGYSFTHFWATLLLTFLTVALLAGFFWYFGRLRETPERRLWGKGEEYIFLAGVFLVRWPLLIPYVFFSIVLAIIWSFVCNHILRKNQEFLNLVPFFTLLVLPLLYFQALIIKYLLLTSLLMPF